MIKSEMTVEMLERHMMSNRSKQNIVKVINNIKMIEEEKERIRYLFNHRV